MSTYDDRDSAITRDPGYQQPMPPQYGYGMHRPGFGLRPRGWSETKPFFMTSEFLATLLGILAVAITAAVAEDIDSRLATSLIAGLIGLYTLSRGIAKSGTRSRAVDPRDELDLSRSHDKR